MKLISPFFALLIISNFVFSKSEKIIKNKQDFNAQSTQVNKNIKTASQDSKKPSETVAPSGEKIDFSGNSKEALKKFTEYHDALVDAFPEAPKSKLIQYSLNAYVKLRVIFAMMGLASIWVFRKDVPKWFCRLGKTLISGRSSIPLL